MKRFPFLPLILLLAAGGLVLWVFWPRAEPAAPKPAPAVPTKPQPKPRPPRCPNCPREEEEPPRVFGAACSPACACGCNVGAPCRCGNARKVGAPCSPACTCGCNVGLPCYCNGPAPAPAPPRPLVPLPEGPQDGEPMVDLLAMPSALRPHNIASRGLGCCVFRSIDYAARYQGEPALIGFPEWMVKSGVAGGGWPAKVENLIPKIAADRKMPTPRYVQYEGRDPAIIELALKTGRAPGITWGGNHMLTGVYLDSEKGAILDNNRPGEVQWFSRSRFLSGWTTGGGGWVVVLLAPAPSPAPMGPRQRVAEANGEPCPDCPHAAELFGVENWTPPDVERYSLNGLPVAREQALAAVGEGLEDDSAKPFLTLIGADADRAAVLRDLDTNPALTALKGKFRVQSYAPDNWAVSGFGFVTTGKPTVYIQDAAGKVLHRQDDYTGGAEQLAAALRKADPTYKPELDPNLSHDDPLVDTLSALLEQAGLKPEHALVVAAVIAALVALVWRRNAQ